MNDESLIPAPKVSRFKKIRYWVAHHRTRSLVFVGVILITSASAVAYFVVNSVPESAPASVYVPKKVNKPKPIIYYSPLTGKIVETEAATKQAVTAIMLENSPDARPQSGLKDAGVVFEAIAEGGITRFLALYQQEKPGLIGPVRSVRMYYVDWLAPFNASVAHIGGSKAALDEVRNGTYRDIDQFFNAGTYWRASDRWAPHNVYTNFTNLDALNQAKGYTTSEFVGFERKDDSPVETPNASSVSVTISGPLYNSSYVYDKTSNSYLRSEANEPHLDRESGQINPKVVVVIKVTMDLILEDGYRENIQTIGSGQAYIFQDGTVKEVNWQKDSRQAQLSFKDGGGNVIPLNRGQTWITAVPNDTGGATWQ